MPHSKVRADIRCSLFGGPQDGRDLFWPAVEAPELLEFPWQSSDPGVWEKGDAIEHMVPMPAAIVYRLVGVDTISAKDAEGNVETAILRARYVHED